MSGPGKKEKMFSIVLVPLTENKNVNYIRFTLTKSTSLIRTIGGVKPVSRVEPRLKSSSSCPCKGECGMLLSRLPAANDRSIGPEWLPHWSVGTAGLIYAPFSACLSWPGHRGMKFKLLLQPANSIRSGTDEQQCRVILAPFLVRGEGLPFAAHTAGIITLVYRRSPCLLHPAAFVMPDRVAMLNISAPRGQAIRCRVSERLDGFQCVSLYGVMWTQEVWSYVNF